MLHASHALYRDVELQVWFCNTCGAVASRAVRDLAKVCGGSLTAQGRDNLSRLDRGLLPGSGPEAKAYNAPFLRRGRYHTGITGRLGGPRAPGLPVVPAAARRAAGPCAETAACRRDGSPQGEQPGLAGVPDAGEPSAAETAAEGDGRGTHGLGPGSGPLAYHGGGEPGLPQPPLASVAATGDGRGATCLGPGSQPDQAEAGHHGPGATGSGGALSGAALRGSSDEQSGAWRQLPGPQAPRRRRSRGFCLRPEERKQGVTLTGGNPSPARPSPYGPGEAEALGEAQAGELAEPLPATQG